ncbi:MAG TPA: CBS domain-containing protein [Acidimicrobiales bacterium]|nr:CBS domain-containing protein [Acidimicrobiales bacterium]
MRIETLLVRKGTAVATVRPDAAVTEALGLLAHHNVGALVVSSDDRSVDGIISERDIARHLHARGAIVLTEPVSSMMSTLVHTCAPTEELEALAKLMTDHRIRHVPVVDGGQLVGIVSIGDVVKSRMDELETDRRALENYIYAR